MNVKCYASWFLILVPLSASYGYNTQGITGVFFENEFSNALPGALIALYDANDNLLVDSTYSQDNGRFSLSAPKAKGAFYVIATKDNRSQRVNFEYDPQNPPVNIEIKYQKSRSKLVEVLSYVWSKFDYLLTSVLGFLVGLLYKAYESKNQAQRSLAMETVEIKDAVAALRYNYAKTENCLAVFKKSTGDDARNVGEEYLRMAARMNQQVEELQRHLNARSDLSAVIYTLHKQEGTESYARFKNALRQIKEFTELNANSALMVTEEKKAEYANALQEIENSFLFK